MVDRLETGRNSTSDKWIDGKEAMSKLNCKISKLQELRNGGKIRFSKPSKKIIMYDRDSINEYLEQHAKETF